jgi:hypothetical protein
MLLNVNRIVIHALTYYKQNYKFMIVCKKPVLFMFVCLQSQKTQISGLKLYIALSENIAAVTVWQMAALTFHLKTIFSHLL